MGDLFIFIIFALDGKTRPPIRPKIIDFFPLLW